ncbi:MAG: hypothetical protein V4494_07350 [Chlamydiota bacterium]
MVRFISRCVFFLLLPFYLAGAVYDCFPFFNEIELLKMRLSELDPYVDYFVLVESIETQRGDKKPLYFKENKHLFTEYLPKIVHVEVNENHPELELWEREHFQRNCILRGLADCHADDIIIISDLDEIPRPEAIIEYHGILNPRKRKWVRAISDAYSVRMQVFYFQLNRQTPNGEIWGGGEWRGTVLTNFKTLQEHNPQFFRDHRNAWPCLTSWGWHFTWIGGRDMVRQKLGSVVEGDPNADKLSDEEIDRWMNQESRVVSVDASFPLYIQNNEKYLKTIEFVAEN